MLFRPTIAGSLPKPGWLAETGKLWPKWKLEGADLDQAKRDAALVWIKVQEDAGIEIVSDGERIYPCTNCGLAPRSRAVASAKLAALGRGSDLARDGHGA